MTTHVWLAIYETRRESYYAVAQSRDGAVEAVRLKYDADARWYQEATGAEIYPFEADDVATARVRLGAGWRYGEENHAD